MPRRVSLPGASELFRTTQPEQPEQPEQPGVGLTVVGADPVLEPSGVTSGVSGGVSGEVEVADDPPADPAPAARSRRRSPSTTGRVRHEEKITVYVSVDELLALEEARLRLRAEHGVAVDRGRIVREAISAAMADLAGHGADSVLVRRLTAQ